MSALSAPITVDELRAAWPGVGDAAIADTLGTALTDAAEAAHRDDLLLAWACVLGDPAALTAFERAALAPALAHLRSRGFAADLADEAIQQARVRLLIREPERRPGLLSYRGRGPLADYVRTSAARLALDLARRPAERPDDELAAMVAAVGPDPGLTYMREHYASALTVALRTAWDALPRHDRFVLGLALHHRLGLDEIAQVYGSHRATAARKLSSARATLLAGTRACLRDQLAVDDPTVDSILRIVTTSLRWQALAPVVAAAG